MGAQSAKSAQQQPRPQRRPLDDPRAWRTAHYRTASEGSSPADVSEGALRYNPCAPTRPSPRGALPMTDRKDGIDPMPPNNRGSLEANPDRLDGWKEIAAYLRRAPRTAQRWEAQFGLPVHRIGGEVVYALRSELDAWLASEAGRPARSAPNGNGNGNGNSAADVPESGAPQVPAHVAEGISSPDRNPHPAPRNAHRGISIKRLWQVAAGLAGVVVLGAITAAVLAEPRAIHHWRVSGDELRAFDVKDRELWMRRLPTREAPSEGGPEPALIDDLRRSVIEDLDGDGRAELVYISKPPDPKQHRLFVFEADGTERFSYQRTGEVTFGESVYYGPFAGAWLEVTRNRDGTTSIWYQSRHVPFFAGVIERLDPKTGAVLASYWNGGAISALAFGTFGGRRLVLIGGDANEGHGASLAVFEGGQVGGGNVGGDVAHTCTSCGPVQASAIFLFPRHDIGDAAPSESKVSLIAIKDEAEIQVDVEYYAGEVRGLPGLQHAVAHFIFEPSLQLVHAEHFAGYRILHDEFWKAGRLDHPYGERDVAELVPILRWTGGSTFEPVTLTKAKPLPAPPAAATAPR